MEKINLRDHYQWYKHDQFEDAPDKTEETIIEFKRQERNYEERTRYNNAYYSLNVGDGIEKDALHPELTPEEVYEYKVTMQQLCIALNSLPETQGRRIDAHYILGMSKADIARAEGVSEKNVRQSIKRGLQTMREHMKNYL